MLSGLCRAASAASGFHVSRRCFEEREQIDLLILEQNVNKPIHKALRSTALLVSMAILALSVNVAYAKNIKKQNLLELMTHTNSILVGTVTDKTDGFQKGLPYTEITLKVGQSIKGDHGKHYSFRQFGLIEPKSMGDGRVNLMVTPAGWPTYTKGEQVMLFLHKEASETGFQTTAGLTQGKFTIRGNQIANGVDNDALFSGLKINTKLHKTHADLVNQPGGAYTTQAFLSLVRTAIEEKWIENGVLSNEK